MPMRILRDGPRIPSLILFALFALSLLGGVAATLVNLSTERAERRQVQLTTDIMWALRVSGRALIDAETGQRGYLITGDPAYLAPYHSGSRDFPGAQEKLERLLAPVATQRQRRLAEKARILGTAKLAELALTVELVEAGRKSEALAQVETDRGRNAMAEYRQVIEELETIEEGILAEAVADAQRSEDRFLPILLAITMVMMLALLLLLWHIFRTARAEAEASTARSLAEARDRADLLSRELNHRVKNIFAVIQAIVRMSLRDASDMDSASRKISERINALSVAHSVTQGQLETPVASLEDLIRTAVAPYLAENTGLSVEGPETQVIARQVTPLGLILHELVTNCVKYGAWSRPGGTLEVSWRHEIGDSPMVLLDWSEKAPGMHPAEGPEGFGTKMILASARQLEGGVERVFRDDGLSIKLRFRRQEIPAE